MSYYVHAHIIYDQISMFSSVKSIMLLNLVNYQLFFLENYSHKNCVLPNLLLQIILKKLIALKFSLKIVSSNRFLYNQMSP